MNPLKVLVAEDDMVGRKIMECFLKPYGECVTAADGHEAVALFQAAAQAGQPFNLVLLDIGMPKLAGIEVLKTIRDYERENPVNGSEPVKVVMLTGKLDVDNINKATLLGAADYMIKPIQEEILIRELQRLGMIDDPFEIG